MFPTYNGMGSYLSEAIRPNQMLPSLSLPKPWCFITTKKLTKTSRSEIATDTTTVGPEYSMDKLGFAAKMQGSMELIENCQEEAVTIEILIA